MSTFLPSQDIKPPVLVPPEAGLRRLGVRRGAGDSGALHHPARRHALDHSADELLLVQRE